MAFLEGSLRQVIDQPWFQGQITHVETLSPRQADFRSPPDDLHPELVQYLDGQDIQLYSHQSQAIKLLLEGEDVVIATPTASGKTLAFNLAVMDTMIKNSRARGLYLYPLKALTNDQLRVVKELDSTLDAATKPAVYDGDTAESKRRGIRRESRLILSNPYALHHYLPWHDKWSQFFENLEYIVLDEVHHYRGIFGSNVAFLLRRLQRITEFYDSTPQFILSSATIANPKQHARNLCGRDCQVISNDGSPSGEKKFIFWNSKRDQDNSPARQTSDLLSYFVEHGIQTLCFTKSRRMAELISKWSNRSMDENVYAYRAGYLPSERREIEEGLKKGAIQAVASTNALELGVDIGGLDLVIISGYPGTVTSTWQQAGRAGRGREESAAILLGYEDPLDQYFMNNPQDFFDRSHEHAVIDLDNRTLVLGFLLCAASELPLNTDKDFYDPYRELITELQQANLLRQTPLGTVYSGTGRPVEKVQLNNIGEEKFEVIDQEEGSVLETLDRNQAYREAHPGAVLLHQGQTYVINDLDLDQDEARAVERTVDYHTQPISRSNLQVEEVFFSRKTKGVRVQFGQVNIEEKYLGYKMKKFGQVQSKYSLQLPPIEFQSEGTWMILPDEIIDAVDDNRALAGGLHGLEHALISMIPYHSMCERWDVGGVSSPSHPDTGYPSVFIYDAYEGGIGIAEKSYSILEELLSTTYDLIKNCDCEDGCPSCIYSPKCGNQNDPLDKEASLDLLHRILKSYN